MCYPVLHERRCNNAFFFFFRLNVCTSCHELRRVYSIGNGLFASTRVLENYSSSKLLVSGSPIEPAAQEIYTYPMPVCRVIKKRKRLHCSVTTACQWARWIKCFLIGCTAVLILAFVHCSTFVCPCDVVYVVFNQPRGNHFFNRGRGSRSKIKFYHVG